MKTIIHNFCLFVFIFIGIQNTKAQDPNWSINTSNYQYSSTYTAFLNVDGITLTSSNDKVGAFVNGEIRGVSNVVYEASVAKYVVYLSVYANTNNETINFKIYNSTTNTTVDINKTATFNIDENVGGIFQSYSIASPELSDEAVFTSFKFLGITAVTEEISANRIDIVLPENTNLTSLKAVYNASTNSKVLVGNILQQSASSTQNFTNSIIYRIISENEAVLKEYEVSVSVALNNNPTTVNISTTQSLAANAVPITLDISFSKVVFGFQISDFILENAVLTSFSTQNSQNFTVKIIPLSQGEFSAHIPASISFDENNNQNEISNKLVLNYDILKPVVANISPQNDSNSKWFVVTFNEEVFNVDSSDFELNGMASSNLTISNVGKLAQNQYKINVSNSNTDDGVISLQLQNSNDIKDVANNSVAFSEFESYFKTLKKITITADSKTKIHGAIDPLLTYQITAGNLENDDVLLGDLVRVSGEDVGDYLITSTLSNINYNITFVSANFSITEDFSSFITWNGSNNKDWNTTSNWDKNTIPTIANTVIIPNIGENQPIISSTTGAIVKKLTVNSGASLTINGGGSLIVDGSSTGNITYNVAIPDTNWHLVSSPVTDQQYDNNWVTDNSIAISATTGNRGISTYNNTTPYASTSYWRYFKGGATNTFTNGAGYANLRTVSGNYSFAGTITTSEVLPLISQNDNNWNLIGNPYTSYVDVSKFITTNTNKISDSFLALYVWNGVSYSTITNGYIQPGQGFFINSKVKSGTVSFTKEMQSHQKDIPFYKKQNTSIKMILSDGVNSKSAQINYLEGKSKGLDAGFDLGVFDGVSSELSIFTHLLEDNNEISFGLQTLSNLELEDVIIPIGVKAKADKAITFSFDILNLPKNINLFLEDKTMNTFTLLDEVNTSYEVNLTKALNGVGRFFLHTSVNILDVKEVALNSLNIYKLDTSTIRIVGLHKRSVTVKFFNLLGKELMKYSFISNGSKDVSLSKFTAGVYIIYIQTEVGDFNKKIILE